MSRKQYPSCNAWSMGEVQGDVFLRSCSTNSAPCQKHWTVGCGPCRSESSAIWVSRRFSSSSRACSRSAFLCAFSCKNGGTASHQQVHDFRKHWKKRELFYLGKSNWTDPSFDVLQIWSFLWFWLIHTHTVFAEVVASTSSCCASIRCFSCEKVDKAFAFCFNVFLLLFLRSFAGRACGVLVKLRSGKGQLVFLIAGLQSTSQQSNSSRFWTQIESYICFYMLLLTADRSWW